LAQKFVDETEQAKFVLMVPAAQACSCLYLLLKVLKQPSILNQHALKCHFAGSGICLSQQV
jgi:hypothetical protein